MLFFNKNNASPACKMNKRMLVILLAPLFLQAQQQKDTSLLDSVVITAFQQNRIISCGTIVKMINSNNADRSNKTSLVNSFNSIAGVRMEERSPGSYRINMRGSSLRSPFGVRNVKVYWNNIPVTDAGGNTYFNQFAFNNFASIEIVKGPVSSMYGAGTGGLLLMHSFSNSWNPAVKVEYVTGSYHLQNVLASASFGNSGNRNIISYAHNNSNGYRDNTSNRKDNISYAAQLKVSDKQKLTAAILYDELYYQTPGALTLQEFTANAKQARPAAGGLPGAATAKAAIYQKNFLAGITNEYAIFKNLKNSTSIYGSFAEIKNPTFRNYERRSEPGFGGRTVFSFEKKFNDAKLQLVAGAELQKGFFNTQVSKNKNGTPDTLQTNDDISYGTYNFFFQADINLKSNWIFTAGVSNNKSKVEFTRLNKYPVIAQQRNYNSEISPRLAVQKRITNLVTWYANMSKGFSPPTIAELLPSTGVISTYLEAERGINYETGIKCSLLNNKLNLEGAVYYFKLYNALVSRKDSNNADYFINAGNTKQTGLEASADYATAFNNLFIESLVIKTAYTFSGYTYGDFKKGTADFTGKTLPGVPKHSFSAVIDIQMKPGIYINATTYYASRIFLDDTNSASANSYTLIGARTGYKTNIGRKLKLDIYAGADNILNKVYSLGNDINAAGGRYYNAAPLRNFYAGVALELSSSKNNSN